MGFQIRHQIVGCGQGIVIPVALQNNALVGDNAVAFQQRFQFFRPLLSGRLGNIQQVPPVIEVAFQHLQLFLGKVAVRGVDEHHPGIFRNGLHRQQGQLPGFQIGSRHRVRIPGSQLSFPVAGGQVNHRQRFAGHIGNGPGEHLFPGKLRLVLTGGVVAFHIVDIDVVVAQIPVSLSGYHHQGIVDPLGNAVLAEKIWIYIRVPLDHRQAVTQGAVPVQQLFQGHVLLSGLHHPINRCVLPQILHQFFTLPGKGKEPCFRNILPGQAFRQGRGQQIYGNDNCQGQGANQNAVAARPEGAAAEIGKDPFHSLHLRFSIASTVNTRKRAMTVRSYTTAVQSNTPVTKV